MGKGAEEGDVHRAEVEIALIGIERAAAISRRANRVRLIFGIGKDLLPTERISCREPAIWEERTHPKPGKGAAANTVGPGIDEETPLMQGDFGAIGVER